ncbi:antitoxin Xre/MbcA/ParS toxin-binding domain-containing protein [Rhodococcus sp. KRD197]|uniref:antitoxin Xre/MbcA/ParS toxin-binding domain-containing protein n=1 Tax=Rhodococcus sp. KRD197 TaxID=2729731 RepID=UPI001F493465|nr:antitoxin Xre/MbcA/ParS toxin-binding domain-containing protein [Rhodococcus sp. KRD197]
MARASKAVGHSATSSAVTGAEVPMRRGLRKAAAEPGVRRHKQGAGSSTSPAGRKPRSTAADDPLSGSRVRYLVDAFGGRALAAFVGVSASQPTRWATGEERPGPLAAPLLIDLEHVLAKARLVWGEDAAQRWFVSSNAYLGGARPMDALRMQGPAVVLNALDGETWGGAA